MQEGQARAEQLDVLVDRQYEKLEKAEKQLHERDMELSSYKRQLVELQGGAQEREARAAQEAEETQLLRQALAEKEAELERALHALKEGEFADGYEEFIKKNKAK